MVETWTDVKGYENLYQSSTFGRARSVDRWVKDTNGSLRFCKGKILKPCINGRGYFQVALYKNGKKKIHLVHRLIAEAFLPNPDNLPCVNHRDECKTNNNVENLEFCTYEYNNTYGTRIERIAEKNTNGKQCKPILQYTLDGQFVREWASATQAEREGGFSSECICRCCKGKQKTHKGFIFKYK